MNYTVVLGSKRLTLYSSSQYMSRLRLLLVSLQKWWLKLLSFVSAVLAVHHEPIVENNIETENENCLVVGSCH